MVKITIFSIPRQERIVNHAKLYFPFYFQYVHDPRDFWDQIPTIFRDFRYFGKILRETEPNSPGSAEFLRSSCFGTVSIKICTAE